jgi:hypothetical protein
MYLAGVSVRRVEDITEALWGTRVSPSTVSDLNKKIYGTIEAWRNRPIEGDHPYVYLDGIVLKRSWAGEVRNVSLLVAIGVNERGYREILGICEGAKAAFDIEQGVDALHRLQRDWRDRRRCAALRLSARCGFDIGELLAPPIALDDRRLERLPAQLAVSSDVTPRALRRRCRGRDSRRRSRKFSNLLPFKSGFAARVIANGFQNFTVQ